MIETKSLYRAYLARVFEDRCQRNSRYSLRSFARDLGVSPPRLSGVLNGKFGLSRAAADKIAKILPMNTQERAWFCDSAESEHARSPRLRESARERLESTKSRFQNLATDQFRVISDWYHFAILELTQIETYRRGDAAVMAKRLRITTCEAEQALKRLIEFDLLTENEDGKLGITGSFFANAEGTPSDAIRSHQIQLLQRAEQAIHDQTVDEREIRSLTVALGPSHLGEFKRMIADFQKKVQASAEADQKPKTEVYALTIQLFRLTEKKNHDSK